MKSIKGKNILVTGGAGFIGSHLVDGLLASEAEKVIVVDNFFLGKKENLLPASSRYGNLTIYRDDARNFGVMQSVIAKEKVDVIYNLATIPLNYSFFNPFDAFMVNIEIANTLLELLKLGTYQTLVHSSSSEAYGTALYSPMDEDHPFHPTTPYAASKASVDMMLMSFMSVQDLDITIVRPFNNYGPRQNDQQLAGIIPLTARRILEGKKPIIYGDGEQTRDFIYVSDTVRAFIMAYENEKSRGRAINLGSGLEISMNHLVAEICDYYGYKAKIEYRPARRSDVRRLCASSQLARKLLGFKPEVGLKEGLVKTLDWYEVNRSSKTDGEQLYGYFMD